MKIKETITNLAVDILVKAAIKLIESYVIPEVNKELEEMMKEDVTINTPDIKWNLAETTNKQDVEITLNGLSRTITLHHYD